jgi:hypothetical protein
MQEKHQKRDGDRKGETHQRQHSMKCISYERMDANNDILYAQHYSLRKHTQ